MAKEQNLALNPAKISGQCGRLLCCLSYEFNTYCRLKKELPKSGERVIIDGRQGVVTDANIISGKITLRMEDDRNNALVVTARELQEGRTRPAKPDIDALGETGDAATGNRSPAPSAPPPDRSRRGQKRSSGKKPPAKSGPKTDQKSESKAKGKPGQAAARTEGESAPKRKTSRPRRRPRKKPTNNNDKNNSRRDT
jgi:hypothetical protein